MLLSNCCVHANTLFYLKNRAIQTKAAQQFAKFTIFKQTFILESIHRHDQARYLIFAKYIKVILFNSIFSVIYIVR